jgi:hypothetical protein
MSELNQKNKPLKRIEKILDFIKKQQEENPDQETFLIDAHTLSTLDPLLEDSDLLEIAFKTINQESAGVTKIEFRFIDFPDFTAVNGSGYQRINRVWFYVSNNEKFEQYRNDVKEKIEKENKEIQFILEKEGRFYQEGSDNRHQFKRGSKPYNLLQILAKRKAYISTKELAERLGYDDEVIKVRKLVGIIRQVVTNKLKLPGKSLFEHDNIPGYRIRNITLK